MKAAPLSRACVRIACRQLALLVLTCLQASTYTFLLPQILLVRFDVEGAWTYRFQLLTLQMITLSLLAVSVASMRIWPTADLSAAHFDKLYRLPAESGVELEMLACWLGLGPQPA